ncbi:unnamed protein product [Staurois parvus]|uniref:Uncharacterized protein n=1 Tax=Staurois parvus TaxID=386267 RepID=A0ABN9B7Y0_9NEOB|nr:unnamed protein product [Staurois parvus]
MQRKLVYPFPLWFVKPVLGPVAWRFLRDLGGMKSPILGPHFGSSQRADCTGVCRPFRGSQAMILGSTPADGVRRAPPRQTGGLCLGVRRSLPWSQVKARLAVC